MWSCANGVCAKIGGPVDLTWGQGRKFPTNTWTNFRQSAAKGCPTCDIFWKAISCFLPDDKALLIGTRVDVTDDAPANAPYITLGLFTESGLYAEVTIWAPGDGKRCSWPLAPAPPESHDMTIQGRVQRINTWLGECQAEHKSCRPSEEHLTEDKTPLPTRVLDVSPQDAVGLRLHVNRGGETGRYICLSHRWGGSKLITTTTETLESWKREIPPNELSKTFRDAVAITRQLGVRYLWIDSLCIIQDQIDDWSAEAEAMRLIYRNALLTLAGTRCNNGDDYLLQPFKRTIDGLDEKGQPQAVEVRFQSHCAIPYSSLPGNPLLSRGWVFQERLLSRRFLHFGYDELLWECMEQKFCEYRCNSPHEFYFSGRKSIDQRIPRPDPRMRAQQVATWHWLVEEYTKLELTKDSDRHIAILGLAEELRPQRGKYLAGLWEDSIAQDLAWTAAEDSKRPRPPKETMLAPSWSWTSVLGPCHFTYLRISGDVMFSLESVRCPAPAGFPKDKLALGCITLKGNVLAGQSSCPMQALALHRWIAGLLPSSEPTVYLDGADTPTQAVPFCLCLRQSRNQAETIVELGLLLRCVDETQSLYERIGLVKVIRPWLRLRQNRVFLGKGRERVVNIV